MPDKQWYTNKDLFELIIELQTDMKETRSMIRKYNGLYGKVAEVKTKVDHVQTQQNNFQAQQKGKNLVGSAIRNWGGWIFGLASFIALLIKLL